MARLRNISDFRRGGVGFEKTQDSFASESTWASSSSVASLPTVSASADTLPSLDFGGAVGTLDSLPELPFESFETEHVVDEERWGIDALYHQGFELEEFLDEVMFDGKIASFEDHLHNGCFTGLRRAVRVSDDKELIVKTVSCARGRLPTAERQALAAEYHLLTTLQHPCVVSPLMFLETAYDAWLVMDCEALRTVQGHVERHGPFAEVLAKSLFSQLLKGLSYIHGHGLVHGGVRPSSLLYHGKDQLKLTNFEHTRQIGEATSPPTPSSSAMPYEAPEVLLGEAGTDRADMWAAGMSLYFKLLAVLPFDVRQPAVIQALARSILPSDLHELKVDGQIARLLACCLRPEASLRPSAEAALQEVLPQGPAKSATRFATI